MENVLRTSLDFLVISMPQILNVFCLGNSTPVEPTQYSHKEAAGRQACTQAYRLGSVKSQRHIYMG